jgi:hypothetical protein
MGHPVCCITLVFYRYRGSLMVIITMIMAIIVCLVIIVIKQYIEYSKDITAQSPAVNQPVLYNRGSSNKALVTIGQITMVLVCIVLAFIPALLVNNFCLQLDPSLLMIIYVYPRSTCVWSCLAIFVLLLESRS